MCRHVFMRSIVVVALVSAAAAVHTARAQCPGDPPSDDSCAPRVIPGEAGVYEVLMDATAATADFTPACGFNVGHTVWFSITPADDSTITFTTCHPETSYDTVVQVYTPFAGSCTTLVQVGGACEDDSAGGECLNACDPVTPRSSTVSFLGAAGATYLIQVGSYDQNSAACALCLGVTATIVPLNDDCANAKVISGLGTFPFNNSTATTDGVDPPLCPAIGRDLWYEWTALTDGFYRIRTCGLTGVDTNIAIYDDTLPCHDPLGFISCNDDGCGLQSTIEFFARAGPTIRIRIGSYDGAAGGGGQFLLESIPGICVQGPSNCQALGVLNSVFASDSNTWAADDFRVAVSGAVNEICWLGRPADNLDPGMSHDFEVTYYYDDGANGPDLPGALLAQFRESAGTLAVQVQTSAPVFQYVATHAGVAVDATRCYWISVVDRIAGSNWDWFVGSGNGRAAWDVSPATGWADATKFTSDLSWCLNLPLASADPCALAPDNDSCVAALSIAGYGTFAFDNEFALSEPGIGGDCLMERDVWYLWTAPADGSVLVSTVGQTTIDSVIAFYDASDGCTSAGGLSESYLIACNDDAGGGVVQSVAILVAQTGATYLLRLGSIPGTPGGNGTFSISPSGVVTLPPTSCQLQVINPLACDSNLTDESAEEFRLLASSSVDTVCWWGRFLPSLIPGPHDFEVRYYADGPDQLPGTLLGSFSESGGTLVVMEATAGSGVEYCGEHVPFPLPAGQRLWLSIRELLSGGGTPYWVWQCDFGKYAAHRYEAAAWIWEASPADLAFCLNAPLADLAACPADSNRDGSVTVLDLLALLGTWGTCPASCLSDINDDGSVSVIDLLDLLASWGACP